MSINKKLTIAAMTENIRKQEERREKFKQDLLAECPFKINERVKLVNVNTGAVRFAFVKAVFVTDSGEYRFKLYHFIHKPYGPIQWQTELGFMETIEKCEPLKIINHDRTKQRFNRIN